VVSDVVISGERRRQRLLPFPGTARWNEPMAAPQSTPADAVSGAASLIGAALDRVGPRLQRVRAQRGISLTEVAQLTGISKGTLSRLENGQRRPSLELLLPLAQTYRVPIDDLVGAPEAGDPRIRLKPMRVNGRTVLPLTRPGGIQAWKIIIPTSQSEPDPRTHDGFEWLYGCPVGCGS
jgi:transcriptional regulator with XRE-family HTH domain